LRVTPPRGADDHDPLVFVRGEAFDGALVTAVFHEWDGDWQYLTAEEFQPERMERAHQSHLIEVDPTLRELADMPPGVWAHRHEHGASWTFDVLDAEGE
jgi:hypothetical protein